MIRVATTAFNYTAIDAGGKQKKGTIEAARLRCGESESEESGIDTDYGGETKCLE